jgi:hypothetical protein
MIVLDRYDPRKDKEAVKELFEDFIENIAHFPSDWDKFEAELNKRVLDLQYRNSIVIAREEDKIVGLGTFTIFRDYLGNDRVLIHQVMTRKSDSFKKGIEELVITEVQKYISRALSIDKFYFICPDSDGNLRSLLLKLNQKKTKFPWYENQPI